MKAVHLRRSAAAVSMVMVCLLATANPAAAVIHDSVSFGGTATFTKSGVTETLSLGNDLSCPSPPPGIEMDITGSSVVVTDFYSKHVQVFSTLASYEVILNESTVGSTPGTISSTPPHTITGMRLGVTMQVYDGDCTSGTLLCSLAFILYLSGTATSTTSGGTYNLSGATVGVVVAYPTCPFGPTQLINTASSVTSLRGEFTT